MLWRVFGRVLGGLAAGDSDRLGMFVLCVVFLGVNFLVLFQVLRPLERLGADLADVRLEGRVDLR